MIDKRLVLLSEQEQKALPYYLFGFSSKIIAKKIGVNESTVKSYMRRICLKFDVSGRQKLLLKFINNKQYLLYCIHIISSTLGPAS